VLSLIQNHIHANIPKDIWRTCPLQPDILNLSGKREKACLPAGFSALERRSPCRMCRRPSPFDPGGTEPKPPLQVPHFQSDATVSKAAPANPAGSGVCRSLPPGGRGVPASASSIPGVPSQKPLSKCRIFSQMPQSPMPLLQTQSAQEFAAVYPLGGGGSRHRLLLARQLLHRIGPFSSPQGATSQQNPCRLQRAPLPSCA
jgi:hypothetical protein